jgi:hypothetical protein
MKAFLMNVAKAIKVCFLWLFSVIEDITTIFREGGKGTPLSSRRIFASTFVVAALVSLFKALSLLTSVGGGVLMVLLLFVPAALCIIAAIFFSYFASLSDIQNTLEEVKDFLSKTKS